MLVLRQLRKSWDFSSPPRVADPGPDADGGPYDRRRRHRDRLGLYGAQGDRGVGEGAQVSVPHGRDGEGVGQVILAKLLMVLGYGGRAVLTSGVVHSGERPVDASLN